MIVLMKLAYSINPRRGFICGILVIITDVFILASRYVTTETLRWLGEEVLDLILEYKG